MLSHELLSRYGALIVFFNVLASSLGLPFPSITTLMTIAASIALAQHDLSHTLLHFGALLGAAVAGGVIGATWSGFLSADAMGSALSSG